MRPSLAATLLALSALAITLLAACDSTPDKRLLQNLNTQFSSSALPE